MGNPRNQGTRKKRTLGVNASRVEKRVLCFRSGPSPIARFLLSLILAVRFRRSEGEWHRARIKPSATIRKPSAFKGWPTNARYAFRADLDLAGLAAVQQL
jgi:hypothetical protein